MAAGVEGVEQAGHDGEFGGLDAEVGGEVVEHEGEGVELLAGGGELEEVIGEVGGRAVVWLNGEKVAALRHDKGLETASIPVKLKKGSNELLVKTNNTDTYSNRRLWVINCVVE